MVLIKSGQGCCKFPWPDETSHYFRYDRGQHLNLTDFCEAFTTSESYFRLTLKCWPLIWASFSILYGMISVTVLSVSYSAMSVWFGPAVEGDNFEVSYIRPTMNQNHPHNFQMLYKVVLIAALLIFLCQALLNGASVCKYIFWNELESSMFKPTTYFL